MHKRKSLRKDAERMAKSTQVKLDEVFYRIEQDKKRTVMLNRFERIKVWNELREIRRVFVPEYVPKCGVEETSEKNTEDQPEHSDTDQNNNKTTQKRYERKTRSNLSDAALSLQRQRQSTLEEKKKQTYSLGSNDTDSAKEKRKCSVDLPLRRHQEEDEKKELSRRPRSHTIPSTTHDSSLSSTESNHAPRESSRPYIPISQRTNTSPSNTMLSISSGYLSFKKLVKDKTHTKSLISPRFRCKSDSELTIEGQSAFLRSTTPKPTTTSANAKQLYRELSVKAGGKNESSTKTVNNSNERGKLSASAGNERKLSLQVNNKRVLSRKKSEGGIGFSSWNNIIEETLEFKKIPEKREVWQ